MGIPPSRVQVTKKESNAVNIIFEHPNKNVGQHVITTGANEIFWSYELNTANFPTYAGEVVQILSIFIGDITITGQLANYKQLEATYSYFLKYMLAATQGDDNGGGNYDERPIRMTYPHRGWELYLQPKSLPGFRYGRDVVAPDYKITAAVVDDLGDVGELKDLVKEGIALAGDDNKFELTGEIGYKAQNPFSDPNPGVDHFDSEFTKEAWKKHGDYFNKLIPSYLDGDFDELTNGFASSPFLKEDKEANAEETRKRTPRDENKR